jgi:formate--tetrahydrofolate ligase
VAINGFSADTDEERAALQELCAAANIDAVDCHHWADGGAGAEALAHQVVALADSGKADFTPLYEDALPLADKIRTVAQKIYGAEDILLDKRVHQQLSQLEADGFGNLPVCMAKTQYSFSTDPTLLGAPSGHQIPVREVRLAAGAGFVVVICGEIMTMPGLPRVPAANSIRIDDAGQVEGLF